MNKNLSNIPSVSQIMQLVEKKDYHNKRYIKLIIKEELNSIRKIAVSNTITLNRNQIIKDILSKIALLSQSSIRPVINATGIVLHTGLGRSPQSKNCLLYTSDAADE